MEKEAPFNRRSRPTPDSICSEITEQSTQSNLQESQVRLAAIVEKSPDFIGIAGLDMTVLYLNGAGQRLVGLNGMGEMRATKRADYFFSEDREFVEQTYHARRAQKRIMVRRDSLSAFQNRASHSGDLQSLSNRRSSTRRAVSFAAIARDITVRKKRELERKRDRLHLLLDLNNRVVSNLDLRELLRALAASIRRVMECDAVSVTLPASRTVLALDFPKSKGFLQEECLVPANRSALGRVFRTGKPWIGRLDDANQFEPIEKALAEGLRFGLGVSR